MYYSKKYTLTIVTIFITLLSAHAQYPKNVKETDFYSPPSNFNVIVNLVDDYNVDNNFSTNDSKKLQEAIDFVTNNGGGKIIIPKGNYTFADIRLKSNVHIEINKNAIIKPNRRVDDRNYAIFFVGQKNKATVENVSITCEDSNDRFTVDFTGTNNKTASLFGMTNTKNFLIANINLIDVQTRFSAINMTHTYNNADGDNRDAFNADLNCNGKTNDPSDDSDDYFFPENGVIKNVSIFNGDYGYGVVQVQSAKNVLFKNLYGKGGVTLRLESGEVALNNLQRPSVGLSIGGIHDIYAENIRCEDGNAALMVSPHAMQNGKIYAKDIWSKNTGFAVRLEGGYTTKAGYKTTIGLIDGTFENTVIQNVHAIYGETAQLKSKHFKFISPNVKNLITTTKANPDPVFSDGAVIGPSGTALLSAGVNFKTELTNITSEGFDCQPKLVDTRNLPDCNDDITISIDDAEVIEGENLKFRVRLNKIASRDIRIAYKSVNRSARNRDFLPVNGTIVIEKGVTTKEIIVETLNDAIDEEDEILVIELSKPNRDFVLKGQAVGTILGSSSTTLSIDQLSLPKRRNALIVYPNPTSQFLYLKNKVTDGKKAVLYNVQGKKYDFVINKGKIDISKLSSGVYFLRLNFGDKEIINRIIKN